MTSFLSHYSDSGLKSTYIFHSNSFRERGIFNQSEVIKEFDRYCKEIIPITGFHIFQYLTIELWFKTIIDNHFEKNNSNYFE